MPHELCSTNPTITHIRTLLAEWLLLGTPDWKIDFPSRMNHEAWSFPRNTIKHATWLQWLICKTLNIFTTICFRVSFVLRSHTEGPWKSTPKTPSSACGSWKTSWGKSCWNIDFHFLPSSPDYHERWCFLTLFLYWNHLRNFTNLNIQVISQTGYDIISRNGSAALLKLPGSLPYAAKVEQWRSTNPTNCIPYIYKKWG